MNKKNVFGSLKNWLLVALASGVLSVNACKTPVEPIVLPPPKADISQTVALKDYVNIGYNARIKNLSNKELDVYKNNQLILSRAINPKDTTYSEIFSYSTNKDITAGTYNFKLCGKTLAGNDTSITSAMAIPKYPLTPNFSQLNTEINEGGSTTLNLESVVKNAAINPERNPVSVTNASSLDGKVAPTLNGYSLTLKVNDITNSTSNGFDNYAVNLSLKDAQGATSTAAMQGTRDDLLDVQGTLQDTETHSQQQGLVKVFDQSNNKLGEMQADASGVFNKRLNYRIKDLTPYILIQGREIDATGQEKSYVRTVKLPRQDQKNLLLRVVPYDGLAENGVSVDDFNRHVREVLTPDNERDDKTDPISWNPTILKWDFGEFQSQNPFKEIIISKTPYDSTVSAFFSDATAQNIKNRILDPEDIGSCFNGKISDATKIKIVDKVAENYQSLPRSEYVGRIFIFPWINVNGTTTIDYEPKDGYIDFAQVRVSVDSNGNIIIPALLAHEIIHASGQVGHDMKTLSQELTIMKSSLFNPPSSSRFADKKTSREVIYEDTYKHGQGQTTDGLLRVNDVMARKFLDE